MEQSPEYGIIFYPVGCDRAPFRLLLPAQRPIGRGQLPIALDSSGAYKWKGLEPTTAAAAIGATRALVGPRLNPTIIELFAQIKSPWRIIKLRCVYMRHDVQNMFPQKITLFIHLQTFIGALRTPYTIALSSPTGRQR